jgi:prepilin peptidase CpaA
MSALAALVPVMLFPAVVIVAAMRDVTTFTIPNWLSLAAIAAFFPSALLAHMALPMFELAMLIGVLALVLGIAMFALGWIGGGDAKLFAAASMWLGLSAVAPFLAWTGIAGGGLAVGLLLLRRTPVANLIAGPTWVERLLEPKGDVPYGVAIAIGALAAFPMSPIFHALG